jgi:hypothetical protein
VSEIEDDLRRDGESHEGIPNPMGNRCSDTR